MKSKQQLFTVEQMDLLMDVPVNKIKGNLRRVYFIFTFEKHQNILDDLAVKENLTDEIKSTLEKVAADLSSKYAK